MAYISTAVYPVIPTGTAEYYLMEGRDNVLDTHRIIWSENTLPSIWGHIIQKSIIENPIKWATCKKGWP